MATLLKITTIAALCYGAIVVWMYLSQRSMLFYPRTGHVATPDQINLEYEDVWLKNRLGQTIHGWWVAHEAPRYVVLFAHGNGGNVSHRLETFRIFHQMELSTLIYDYSGYGQSEGEPGEEAMYADARAAWDWLVQEKGVAPASIILFGRSLGGAVTARLAAELASEGVSPAGVVMESTFTSVPEMGSYVYPWLPVRYLAKYQYDSVEALQHVSVPVLFGHSQDDEIIPYAIGLRLYEGHNGPKSFMEMRGDHNAGYLIMGSVYPDSLNEFFRTLEP